MFNMNESRTYKGEREYHRFIDAVAKILGRGIELGSADESDAFDLYSDGCTDPAEAAAEMQAQAVFLGIDNDGLACYQLPFQL